MSNVLLTIAIPTYNRAHLLDECLTALAREFGNSLEIEIIVSNNASTDTTSAVVKRQIKINFPDLRYFENSTNLGPDYNITQCFREAQGKYVWIFSDDDLLLATYGIPLLHLLRSDEWGIVHLRGLWYSGLEAPQPVPVEMCYQLYKSGLDFIQEVHYWVTFITGNIVNKSILINQELTFSFNGTSLTQLGWILPAALSGYSNVLITTPILACRANNTGGYKLFEVFGKNFNFIMNSLIRQGYDSRIKDVINNHLLISFFPMFLNEKNEKFVREKYLTSMLPIFWRYKIFWKSIFPSLLRQQLNIV
jgi:abequosyltransferase